MEQEKEAVVTAQGAESDNSATTEINATYAEATAVGTEELATDEETYLELEDYESRRFKRNDDIGRPCKLHSAASNGGSVIRMTRTGQNESNGCFVKALDVAAGFRVNAANYPTHTQVSFLLANGKILTGYVFNSKSRKGYYFPRTLAKEAISLPKFGKRLPVKATKLVIG